MKRKRRKKKREDKRETLRKHSSRRLAERYGLSLTTELREKIISMIRAGKTQHVETQSNRVSVHLAKINGQDLPVVYDKERKEIITFLEKKWITDTKENSS